MVLGWLTMLIFAFHACTHMAGASDTWKAIAAGRHYVNHGVDAVEPFSKNSLKAGPTQEDIETWPKSAQWVANKVGLETVKYWHPTGWVNQNWLAGVIFYWLTHESPFADAETSSFNSLVYLKFTIYILTIICVYYTGVTLGVNPALSAVFACFTLFVGRSFFHIRPADFTNLFTVVFLLILVLTTYRNIFYIWLIVPLVVFWCNVHGGYIYVFLMLVPFIALNFLTSFFPKRFVSIELKGIVHSIAVGFVAFLAMILFNPFHLTNLTHIFVISIGKHAKQWRSAHEWHPAFEWRNPVGDEIPFLIMFIIACSALLIWIVVLILTSRSVSRSTQQQTNNSGDYQWPKADLPLIAVAALTICMAIRSRRFIPMAAITTCPIIAMLIDQIIRMISATRNFRKQNRLYVSPTPRSLQLFLIVVGFVAVLTFSTWWGLKFKRVYLDPWPTDVKLNSIFMRMTASHAKPFYACRFIKQNKLKGNIFNYWTEGCFIALGQQPDPNTGRTPLQLFMDGRAQTAYELKFQDLWMEIISGGPIARTAKTEKRRLTDVDYIKIGRWVSEELRKYNVNVVLMPSSKSRTPFVKGLEHNSDWRLVFFDNKHKLFIDITTADGKELLDGLFNGKTFYPDVYSKNLTLAHNMLSFAEAEATKEQGLHFAIKAFELNPSHAPMQEVVSAARFSKLKPIVDKFCKNYFDQFVENKQHYIKEHGYHNRIIAASIAYNYLQKVAKKQKNAEDAKFYAAKNQEYRSEQKRILESKRW